MSKLLCLEIKKIKNPHILTNIIFNNFIYLIKFGMAKRPPITKAKNTPIYTNLMIYIYFVILIHPVIKMIYQFIPFSDHW